MVQGLRRSRALENAVNRTRPSATIRSRDDLSESLGYRRARSKGRESSPAMLPIVLAISRTGRDRFIARVVNFVPPRSSFPDRFLRRRQGARTIAVNDYRIFVSLACPSPSPISLRFAYPATTRCQLRPIDFRRRYRVTRRKDAAVSDSMTSRFW